MKQKMTFVEAFEKQFSVVEVTEGFRSSYTPAELERVEDAKKCLSRIRDRAFSCDMAQDVVKSTLSVLKEAILMESKMVNEHPLTHGGLSFWQDAEKIQGLTNTYVQAMANFNYRLNNLQDLVTIAYGDGQFKKMCDHMTGGK